MYLLFVQETDETYDNIKDCSDLASVEVIQSCPVVLEEEYTMQQDSMFQQVHTRMVVGVVRS